jgi:N-acetylmuramoyl-L-alanine amidase
MRIVISSGHGKHVRGASGYIDEVDEARRVVQDVAVMLRRAGVEVATYHDNQSHSQNENLHRIVDHHNSFAAEGRRDVSVHFNAYVETEKAMGTECLYVSQERLAESVAAAIAQAGHLIDRGAKYRDDLYFLNHTTGSLGAILIEVCFVDSESDAAHYDEHFSAIVGAIARCVAGHGEEGV